MIQGTPVLDVKPYIPYDIIPSTIPIPMASDHDGKPLNCKNLEVPEWIYEVDIPWKEIVFNESALFSIRQIVEGSEAKSHNNKAFSGSTCNHIKSFLSETEAITVISQILRQDIRSLYRGRGKDDIISAGQIAMEGGSNIYEVRVSNLHIKFVTFVSTVEITEVTVI